MDRVAVAVDVARVAAVAAWEIKPAARHLQLRPQRLPHLLRFLPDLCNPTGSSTM